MGKREEAKRETRALGAWWWNEESERERGDREEVQNWYSVWTLGRALLSEVDLGWGKKQLKFLIKNRKQGTGGALRAAKETPPPVK